MELRFLTRLQCTTALVTPCPRPRLVRSTLEHPIQAPVIAGKEHGTAADKAFLARLTNRDLVLYSDGSKRGYELPNGAGKAVGTGWRFVAFQGDQQLYAAHGRLSEAEVFERKPLAQRKQPYGRSNTWQITRPTECISAWTTQPSYMA